MDTPSGSHPDDTRPPRDRPVALVADDERVMRLVIRKVLERDGWEVLEAKDGREAVDLVSQSAPDVVLLDRCFPCETNDGVETSTLDGFDACEQIRKLPGGEHIPVLMITGMDDEESISRAYAAGATDFQAKPFNATVLRHRVQYLLRAKRNFDQRVRSEAKTRALLDALPDAMLQIDRHGTVLDHKPAHNGEDSWDANPARRRSAPQTHAEVTPDFLEGVKRTFDSGAPQRFEYVVSDGGDDALAYEATTVPNGADHVLAIVRDITERKRAARELKTERDYMSAVVDTAAALVMILDGQGRVTRFNKACERASGQSFAEVEGKNVWELVTQPEQRDLDRAMLTRLLTDRATTYYENSWRRDDGSQREIAWSNSVLLDEEGAVDSVICTGLDITERNQVEEKLRFLSDYDPLTGLANRALMTAHLSEAVTAASNGGDHVAVLFLDLDRFKLVNGTLGHARGDLLLKGVADRLTNSLRLSDVLARDSGGLRTELGRLGGDQFAVILKGVSSPTQVSGVSERLLKAMARPFKVDDQECRMTASVGISLSPADGDDGETLLKNAEAAMYSAQNVKSGSSQFYSESMRATVKGRLTLETELRHAIDRQELVLYYQPKVRADSRRVVGAEGLVRWQHPAKGLIQPGAFIRVAEETGLIGALGEWVLRAACEQVVTWQERGIEPVPVAINISTLQFKENDLLQRIAMVLNEYSMDPRYLAVEITEGLIMEDASEAREVLRRLNELGIKIAIDDFGTGYSALSSLKELPVHTLKIDRAFIMNLPDDHKDLAITRAVIAMAHGLGLTVIAEGVESEEQAALLLQEGCDELQGYLISQPIPAQDFTRMLVEVPGGRSTLTQVEEPVALPADLALSSDR